MQHHAQRDEEGGLLWLWPILGVALCCGGPTIFALVASAGITSGVFSGLLPAAGVVLAIVLMAGAFAMLWRRRASAAAACCDPPEQPLIALDPTETKAS